MSDIDPAIKRVEEAIKSWNAEYPEKKDIEELLRYAKKRRVLETEDGTLVYLDPEVAADLLDKKTNRPSLRKRIGARLLGIQHYMKVAV